MTPVASLVTWRLNEPPVMVPLLITETDTLVLPALKVASFSTVMLWMLLSSRVMVSGASAFAFAFRLTVPVMVSSPVSLSMVKLLNVPPLMMPPPLVTVAFLKSPPEMT